MSDIETIFKGRTHVNADTELQDMDDSRLLALVVGDDSGDEEEMVRLFNDKRLVDEAANPADGLSSVLYGLVINDEEDIEPLFNDGLSNLHGEKIERFRAVAEIANRVVGRALDAASVHYAERYEESEQDDEGGET